MDSASFTLKDMIYLGTMIVSVTVVIVGMRANIGNLVKEIQRIKEELAKDISLLKKVVFRDDGEMNIVTRAAFKETENQIYKRIRHESDVTQKAFDKIDTLGEHIMSLTKDVNNKFSDVLNILERKQ